jgi:hypothetical protein
MAANELLATNQLPTLVLIATGQNVPNAISWGYYKADLNPADPVRIYATPNMMKSAQALQEYMGVGKIYAAKDNSHTEFRNFLEGLGDRSLIVNLTGGLKTFWLTVPYLVKRKGAAIIYRDFDSSQWYEVFLENGAIQFREIVDIAQHEQIEVDDVRSLANFFQIQLCNPQIKVSSKSLDEECGQNAKDWIHETLRVWLHDMGTREKNRERGYNGTSFEKLVACAFRVLLGAHVFLNIELKDDSQNLKENSKNRKDNSQTALECDVFASVGAKQFLIETKLVEGDGRVKATEMLCKLASAARALGGLNARPILILPNWCLDQAHLKLADLLGITVWGPNECKTLFTRICELGGNTEDSQQVQEWNASLERVIEEEYEPTGKPFDVQEKLSRRVPLEYGAAEDLVPWLGFTFSIDNFHFLYKPELDSSKGPELYLTDRCSKELRGIASRVSRGEPFSAILPTNVLFVWVPARDADEEAKWTHRSDDPDRGAYVYIAQIPEDQDAEKFAKEALNVRLRKR